MAEKKVFVLGIDGLDARITEAYLAEGLMPNLQAFLDQGAARECLAMIGGQPTVSPPMWTTLSTGASPFVHGVHDYYRKGSAIGEAVYNFDSRNSLAEPLWNVTAEAELATLVWHWPGSAWPPTSSSERLLVVDGTQPVGVNWGNAVVDQEKLLIASDQTPQPRYQAADTSFGSDERERLLSGLVSAGPRLACVDTGQGHALPEPPREMSYSPITPAQGWAGTPADARECTILHSRGLIYRPCLLLKNADGVYDTLQILTSKQETQPLAVLRPGQFVRDILDDAVSERDETFVTVNRSMCLLEMKGDGTYVKLWISAGMDFRNDALWHPHELLGEIVANVGYPQPCCVSGGLAADIVSAAWEAAGEWTSAAIHYLAQAYDLRMIFSHFHNVDLQGHRLVPFLQDSHDAQSAETAGVLLRQVYQQADRYIGRYVDMLDDGWTILIVSDHGLTCPQNHPSALLNGCDFNGRQMVDWGYTVLQKDADGHDLPEVDWGRTRAVMWRVGEIWLNLKGRDEQGIVEPAEQWALEEEIMTRLLAETSLVTGHRVCMLALRNKDAVLLGMGGPTAGDILFFSAEGYTADHGDSLSTVWGAGGTSAMSVFAAAGPGIKAGCRTKRVIHHVDVAPTIAALLGTRMPVTCEGAPIYQILQ